MKIEEQYNTLATVLSMAFDQASVGKGKVRHADNEPFDKQIICEVSRRLQNHPTAAPLFQAVKKIYESGRLNPPAAIHELLGAINYTAAAIILLKEKFENEQQSNTGENT